MWIITLFGGVHIYYPEENRHEHVPLKSGIDGSDAITAARFLEDNQGNVWIGTQTAGLFRLVEDDQGWKSFHYLDLEGGSGIASDFINTVVEMGQQDVWVGTQSGLYQYIAETDSFRTITKADGLKDDAIKGILQDKDNYLWLSTSKGIIRFDPKSGETIDYNISDGLQGNQFNASSCFQTSEGELVFGGSNGFNIFSIKEARKLDDQPDVFISSLKIFNQPVFAGDAFGVLNKDISQSDSILFNHNHSVINFEFNALTYRHPENVFYAYYLEGLENDWNYIGNNGSATYTNLNPGNYTLRIKSTNSDGIWNENEKSLFIRVNPPFWETVWFRTAIILFLIAIIYIIYFIRVNNIKKYQAELEKEIALRTQELQLQKEKLQEAAHELSEKNEEIQRFTYAVSHDLKSPLNSIKGISDIISMELDFEKFPSMEEYMNYINLSCTTMGNLISDITKVAKLGKIENKMEILDANEIIKSAGDLVIGRMKKRNAKLMVSENLPTIHGDRNRMIQVFENLIDNAIKYMGIQSDPLVHISFKEDGEYNKFMIMDNGSGMDSSSLDKLFNPFERFDNSVEGTGLGLYMIKNIIESHAGTIVAESEGKGMGTTFIVSLPKVS